MTTMDPVFVRYERTRQPILVGRWQMQAVTPQGIECIRAGVESGRINEVVLIGPNVSTGWRVGVRRLVRFVERPTVDEQDAIAQRQAQYRIVEMESEDRP